MILTMRDILAIRAAGKSELLSTERLVRVVPMERNPFRQFCKLKGIRGKGKKKFRKAHAMLTSAKAALAEQQTSGGIIHASPNR